MYEKGVSNGAYKHSKALDHWTSDFQCGKGRYCWNRICNENGRTTVRSNGMDGRTRRSDYIRDSEDCGRFVQEVRKLLSELQKLIVGGLKLCGMQQDDIVAITLMLKDNEEQQWKMADYLETIIEEPPSRQEIFSQAAKIAGMTLE